MINEKQIGMPSMRGRNYLLVDLEQLQKEEFAQRRKLRIQQVRLQSKDLSSRVLQDVRNERKLHVARDHNNRADVFKRWQSRKLHEINLKYKENINAGERAAAELPDPELEIKHQVKKNTEAAQERGKRAIAHLKTEKDNVRCEREKFSSRREKIRTLESIRAAMVASLSNALDERKSVQSRPNAGETAECFEAQEMDIEKQHSEEPEDRMNIPVVPPLSLQGTPIEEQCRKEPIPSSNKSFPIPEAPPPTVQVYDHHNPCTITQRQPPTVRVEKTSILSQTNAREAAEIEAKEEAERQTAGTGAEDEARINRGKKALAKEMVRRDFDRVMTRLDELAREERKVRVTELPKLPPEVYMNDERTAMRNKKQQQDLESAFEGVIHGNMGIKFRKDTMLSKETIPKPVIVEKAVIPEEMKLDMQEQMMETSLPKLNVGICDDASTPSFSGYEVSSSSTQSTSNIGDSESDRIECAGIPVESAPSEKVEEKADKPESPEKTEEKDLCNEREELQRRIERARSILEEKDGENLPNGPAQEEIDEGDHGPLNKPDKGSAAWWCSLSVGRTGAQVLPPAAVVEDEKPEKGKCKNKRKTSVYKHLFEVKGKTLEELDLLVRKGKKDGTSLDYNETTSSQSSSSWGLEEVRVVLKVDDQSSESEPKGKEEEEGSSRPDVAHGKTSGHLKSPRERKKRIAEKKHESKPKEVEDEPVCRQGDPLAKFPVVRKPEEKKEKLKMADQIAQIGRDFDLIADKRKRERKGAKAHRIGLQPPLSESSYISPPSHQELSDSDQAKVLLEEIRAQRKRLEKWVGQQTQAKGKGKSQLGDYIKRLLFMTRESVAELSVSDVSSPVIQLSTPVISDTSTVTEVVEDPLPMKQLVDKSVGTSFNDDVVEQEVQVSLSPVADERVISRSPKSEESRVYAPDLEVAKSLAEIKLTTKSPKYDPSVPFRELPELPSTMGFIPEFHLKPPSPPPPSPEYDELSVLHSKRISLLGAKLMEIREMQKRLITSFHSSGTESGSGSSPTSSPEDVSGSSRRDSSSKESEESPSIVSDDKRKSWEVLIRESEGNRSPESSRSSSGIDEDSEDSLLEKLFLESLTLSESKKSFKPSEEMKAAQKNGTVKTGPPPTALKGGTWIGSDFQVPHELSTIVEVDSRVFSTTSVCDQKKEMEHFTSAVGTQHQLEPLEDPLKKQEVIASIRIRSPLLNLDVGKEASTGLTKGRTSKSPEAEKPFSDIDKIMPDYVDSKITADKITHLQQDEDEGKSDVSLPVSFSSLDDSTEFPENLDDALRILGISPTVLLGRKSSASKDASPPSSSLSGSCAKKSADSSHSSEAGPIDEPRASPAVGTKTNTCDQDVRETVADSEQQKSLLQFTPLGSIKDLSVGTSSSTSQQSLDKSIGGGGFFKEMGLEPSNFQSTPISSFKDFTFDSGSSFISVPQGKVKDVIPHGGHRSMGKSFPELTSLREELGPGRDKSDSPIVPKETPQSMLKHSTPIHSFSGEGSSSSDNSGEQRKSRSCFPLFGDSAPSSISGGNASDGGDWRKLCEEDDAPTPERQGD